MAIDDIYGSERRYERYIEREITNKGILNIPEKNDKRKKYYCKNKANLKYYNKLLRSFEVDDLSYIRRLRLLSVMNQLVYFIDCDLKDANSIEKEEVIIEIRKVTAPQGLKKTEADIKRIGRILFGEYKMPCFFKEIKIKTDVSRQRAREDKLSYGEFERIVRYFNKNSIIQAYLTIAFETLVRPQELLYIKFDDIELFDKYAIINVSEHGKEGIKKLLCIDSYPYLVKAIKEHKDNKNKKAYLFINQHGNQFNPFAINKKIKKALDYLKIDKPITAYSIKRFGVTYRRLQGDDDITIQRLAGWTSTKQLKTYDQSSQQDVFKKELIKKGLIKGKKEDKERPQTKECLYCNELIGFAESSCPKCKRITDKEMLVGEINKQETIMEFLNLLLSDPEEIQRLRDKIKSNPELLKVAKKLKN